MHNCKLTRSSFIDLSLDELPPAKTTQLLAELNDCPICREEYAALTSTLRLSNQALRSSLPGEEFWTGYRARLNAKLLISQARTTENAIETSSNRARTPLISALWLLARKSVTATVRVPVSAALALILLFGVFFFVAGSRGPVNVPSPIQLPTLETRVINVPVVQERLVTRVVYVEKRGLSSRRGTNQLDRAATPGLSDSVARARPDSPGAALSLVGFKPTDQIKLTITRGSYRDEK
jgi:anti-sigma factor RsiW